MRSKHEVVFALFTNDTIQSSEFRVLGKTGQERADNRMPVLCHYESV